MPALAQQETVALGEVMVTARKREESLQDVPIAVTTMSGDALELAGYQDLTALSQSVPNVTLENSRATNSTLTAFIRGIGQQDPVAGFEQGVGIYLDDVYLNRPQAAVLDIYDVERIEVLRGPQGTCRPQYGGRRGQVRGAAGREAFSVGRLRVYNQVSSAGRCRSATCSASTAVASLTATVTATTAPPATSADKGVLASPAPS
jgi:iron complex outermembrane receptor protein